MTDRVYWQPNVSPGGVPTPQELENGVEITDFMAPSVVQIEFVHRPDEADGRRVQFEDLSEPEREAIKAWCRKHKIDPENVPIIATDHIRFDPATDEWIIPQFTRRDGRMVIDQDRDEVVWHNVRRVSRGRLPWRCE